jgi:hypothetical protein
MLSSANIEKQKQFAYYDRTGKHLGDSHGKKPCDTLYHKAHYVVVNQEDMIKNCDSKTQIAEDLRQCEKDLLQTPVSDMAEILYLNRLIRALRQCLAA